MMICFTSSFYFSSVSDGVSTQRFSTLQPSFLSDSQDPLSKDLSFSFLTTNSRTCFACTVQRSVYNGALSTNNLQSRRSFRSTRSAGGRCYYDVSVEDSPADLHALDTAWEFPRSDTARKFSSCIPRGK